MSAKRALEEKMVGWVLAPTIHAGGHMRIPLVHEAGQQVIRLPEDLEFPGVTELTIERRGDTLILRPVRPSWTSFADEPRADADFLRDRPDLIEEGCFSPDKDGERLARGGLG